MAQKLSFPSILTAIIVSVFLLITSTYIALKLGALPWPIFFSIVASAGIIKLFAWRKVSIHEINVASAGASIGGLIAAAVAFTLPGIILLQRNGQNISMPSYLVLFLVCLVASLLGIFISTRQKNESIEKLPFPSGSAGAYLLKEGKNKSKYFSLVIAVGALFFIISYLISNFTKGMMTFPFLQQLNINFVLLFMPLAIAVGYILGPKPTFSWFSGSIIGWVILIPLLIFVYNSQIPIQIVQNAGMGIILGSGLGFIFSRFRKQKTKTKNNLFPISLLVVSSIIVLNIFGSPLIASIIAAISVLLVGPMAFRMTGSTNIDPLEQFGIFVGLFILFIYSIMGTTLPPQITFIIIFFVSVAAAISGDIGHDYKAARILKTSKKNIIKIDIITAVVVSALVPLVLTLIINTFKDQLFTPLMPAPQATLVASAITGLSSPISFFIGLVLAFLFEIITRKKSSMIMMPFGIGMFLGLSLSFLIAIGGFISLLISKTKKKWVYPGIIIAGAILAGEGLAGFLMGFFKTLSIDFLYLIIPFTIILIPLLIISLKNGTSN